MPVRQTIQNQNELRNLIAYISHQNVYFRWQNPQDEDLHHVEIHWEGGSQILTPLESGNPDAASSYRLTGLTNGQSYNFQLQAVDNSGNQSDPVSITRTPNSFYSMEGARNQYGLCFS